jgi:hypothetical protein
MFRRRKVEPQSHECNSMCTQSAPIEDTVMGKVARRVFPNYGWCERCGLPWAVVEGHITRYRTDGVVTKGCFPLCEGCWSLLTAEERVPFYYRFPEAIDAVRAGL